MKRILWIWPGFILLLSFSFCPSLSRTLFGMNICDVAIWIAKGKNTHRSTKKFSWPKSSFTYMPIHIDNRIKHTHTCTPLAWVLTYHSKRTRHMTALAHTYTHWRNRTHTHFQPYWVCKCQCERRRMSEKTEREKKFGWSNCDCWFSAHFIAHRKWPKSCRDEKKKFFCCWFVENCLVFAITVLYNL